MGGLTTKSEETISMGLFSKDIKTMDDLFVHTLQDIYYAEKRIVGALPDMISKTTSPQLRVAFESHLGETRNHVRRLEQVFQMRNLRAASATCPAIDGIIEEANTVAGDVADNYVLDAALIAATQAVEHYEMTRYGSLIAWAKTLGYNDPGSAGDPRRGEGRGRQADLDRRERREPPSGVNATKQGTSGALLCFS
jgi:ferritin-like metal-binding protein YciE